MSTNVISFLFLISQNLPAIFITNIFLIYILKSNTYYFFRITYFLFDCTYFVYVIVVVFVQICEFAFSC